MGVAGHITQAFCLQAGILFAVFFLLATTSVQAGEIHKWVDASGRVHYADKAPADNDARKIEQLELESRINTIKSVDVTTSDFLQSSRRAREAKEKEKAARAKGVVIYSTAWCGVCGSARRYFRANNIPFSEYDIETTERGRNDYARLQGRGVPIILVGHKRMDGFSPARFQEMYGN